MKHGWLPVVAAALGGCAMSLMHYDGYRGDGTFTPVAALSVLCRDGYTVDLGAIDLSAPGEITRTLQGLPSVEAVIGLAVERKGDAKDSREVFGGQQRPAAAIELTLRDAAGHIVLSRREALTQWIGSRAPDNPAQVFLYQRGTETETPVAPGTVRLERFPIGPDDSWGTYFTPRRGARYTLHFAVQGPDAAANDVATSDLRDVAMRLQLHAVAGCL